jgi:hypothetical protein
VCDADLPVIEVILVDEVAELSREEKEGRTLGAAET